MRTLFFVVVWVWVMYLMKKWRGCFGYEPEVWRGKEVCIVECFCLWKWCCWGFLVEERVRREWNLKKMRGILCVGSNLSLHEGMIIIARAFLYTTLPFSFYFYYLSWLLALHFSFEYYQQRLDMVQIIKRQLLFHLLTISNIYL